MEVESTQQSTSAQYSLHDAPAPVPVAVYCRHLVRKLICTRIKVQTRLSLDLVGLRGPVPGVIRCVG